MKPDRVSPSRTDPQRHNRQRYPGEPEIDDSAPRTPVAVGVPPDAWRCRAKSRQKVDDEGNALRCGQYRETGLRVCRWHGGHPNTAMKHGRYSAVLSRSRERYKQSLNSGDLLDMDEPIAMLDTIVQRVAERLERLDTADLRASGLELFDLARDASSSGDQNGADRLLNKLGDLLRDGVKEDAELERLGRHLERLSKRVEAAWTVQLAKQHAISQRDLVLLMGRFISIVQSELSPSDAVRVTRVIELDLAQGGLLQQPEATEDE